MKTKSAKKVGNNSIKIPVEMVLPIGRLNFLYLLGRFKLSVIDFKDRYFTIFGNQFNLDEFARFWAERSMYGWH